MRYARDYADRMYLEGAPETHWVPFGGFRTMCGLDIDRDAWMGTGCMEEYDMADVIPLCKGCEGWS